MICREVNHSYLISLNTRWHNQIISPPLTLTLKMEKACCSGMLATQLTAMKKQSQNRIIRNSESPWKLKICYFINIFHSEYIYVRVSGLMTWNTERLILDIRGRHRLQSSPLLRLDNDPSGAASFWSILGSHFLVACSGRPATLLEFSPTSEIFAP